MKKIISLILALTFALSVIPSVFAENQDVAENESILVLNALGISELTNPELKIARADFSIMMANIIGYSLDSFEAVFSDVHDTYYGAKAIYTLYNMGLVNGKGDGKFHPEDEMTTEEVIAVILRFLGYQELVNAKGGYPTGYTVVAKEIGLTKGVSCAMGEIITLEKTALLIENLLETNIFSIIRVYDDGTVSRQSVSGNTVAKVYYNMDIITDVVTANRHTSLNVPLDSKERKLVLGDTGYNSANFDGDSYLGYEVKAYIDIDTNEIIHLKKTAKNNTVVFDADMIDEVSDNYIYYNDGMNYELLPKTAAIIYNNKAITTYKESYFDINKGSVELIDNNNDRKFDVVKILSYKNYVVDSVSGDATVIRLKDNQGVIDLKNKYTEYKVFDADGIENPVEMISPNYVLTVAENPDNGYIELTYLEKHINGTVTGIQTGEENIIFIDNEPHIMSEYFMKNQPENIRTGISGMFFVDIFGEVVSYMAMGELKRGYAFLLNIAEKEREADDVSVKLFTQYNETIISDSGKYLTLDGENKIAKNVLSTLRPGGICTPQLVYYELNSKGLITLIDTINKDTVTDEIEFKLIHNSGSTKETFREGSMTFDVDGGDDSVYISNSCVVFTVPAVLNSNGDEYSVISCADLQNSGDYAYKAYSRSKDGVEADVLVLPTLTEATFGAYSYISVIEKITEVVTEGGERVHKIRYWYRGSAYECCTSEYDVAKNLHAGDVLYLAKDIKGNMYNYRYLYNHKENRLIEDIRSKTSAHRFTLGYAYDIINNNLFRASLVQPSAVVDERAEIELHRPATYIYHVKEMPGGNVKISAGTVNDLRDYESFGENCSKIFTHQTYLSDYDLVIYNKQ